MAVAGGLNLIRNVAVAAAGAGIGGIASLSAGGCGDYSLVAVAGGLNLIRNVAVAAAGAGIGGVAAVDTVRSGHNGIVVVAQGFTLGCTADRTSLGSVAVSVRPGMAQCVHISVDNCDTAGGTGVGGVTLCGAGGRGYLVRTAAVRTAQAAIGADTILVGCMLANRMTDAAFTIFPLVPGGGDCSLFHSGHTADGTLLAVIQAVLGTSCGISRNSFLGMAQRCLFNVGGIAASGAVHISIPTDLGAGGSLGLMLDLVMAQDRNFITRADRAADSAGVSGIASLSTGGVSYHNGIAVALSLNRIGNIAVAALGTGVGGVTIFGAGGSGDSSAVAMLRCRDGDGFAADFFAADGAVYNGIIAAALSAGGLALVLGHGCSIGMAQCFYIGIHIAVAAGGAGVGGVTLFTAGGSGYGVGVAVSQLGQGNGFDICVGLVVQGNGSGVDGLALRGAGRLSGVGVHTAVSLSGSLADSTGIACLAAVIRPGEGYGILTVGVGQHGDGFGLRFAADGTCVAHSALCGAGRGSSNSACAPAMAAGFSLDSAADGAGFGGGAGGINPAVAQGCAFGSATGGAGLGSSAGGIGPGVAGGGNFFGIGVATGAGVGHHAGFGAGGSLGLLGSKLVFSQCPLSMIFIVYIGASGGGSIFAIGVFQLSRTNGDAGIRNGSAALGCLIKSRGCFGSLHLNNTTSGAVNIRTAAGGVQITLRGIQRAVDQDLDINNVLIVGAGIGLAGRIPYRTEVYI